MARNVKVLITCDVCSVEIDESTSENYEVEHSFVYFGKRYLLDLCPRHANEFVEAMNHWMQLGHTSAPATERKVTSRRASRAGQKSKRTEELNRVREWARANGYQVGDRGRIHSDILAAYRAATGDQVADTPSRDVNPTDEASVPDGDGVEAFPQGSSNDMWDDDDDFVGVVNPDGSPAGRVDEQF